MGRFINNREVSEEEYDRWMYGPTGKPISTHAPKPIVPVRDSYYVAPSNSGSIGELLGGLGQYPAPTHNWQAMAQMQAQGSQVQEIKQPIAQLPTSGQLRTARALAEFDWSQANNFRYLDGFFAKWGFEPFELV